MKSRKVRKTGAVLTAVALAVAMIPFCGSVPAVAKAKISLNKTKVYLAKGAKVQLKVKGTKAKVTWKSKNTGIAKVSKKGKVTAKKPGTTTIVAKVKGKKYKCKVKVESRAQNAARKLRNYLLKKGKYDKVSDQYYIADETYDLEETGEVDRVYVMANKKNNILHFEYYNTSDSPGDTNVTVMEFNLISRTIGRISYEWVDGYDSEHSIGYKADITMKFTNTGNGLNMAEYRNRDQFEDEEDIYYKTTYVTDPDQLTISYKPKMLERANEAFARWDKLLSKNGYSLKKIGFSKWTAPQQD